MLAAGLGRRLLPLTLWRAKPAIPFLNRPLIEYSLDLFHRSGIEEIAVNLHHRSETVVQAVQAWTERLGPDAPRLVFSPEDPILGTAGAFGRLRWFLEGDDFVVSNGKIYFEQEDLEPTLEHHREAGNTVTMVLTERDESEPFSPVWLSADGRIEGFGRQPESPGARAFTYTGVQVVSGHVVDWIPDAPFDTIRDLYPRIRREGGRIGGWAGPAYWCECSRPERYLRKSFEVLERQGKRSLAGRRLPDGCSPVILGDRVRVGRGARLQRVIAWGDASIGPDCRLRDVILCGPLELLAGTRLEEAVVTPRLETLPGSLAAEGSTREHYVVWPLK